MDAFDSDPINSIFGIARLRLGTAGAGGLVTLPIKNGSRALTVPDRRLRNEEKESVKYQHQNSTEFSKLQKIWKQHTQFTYLRKISQAGISKRSS